MAPKASVRSHRSSDDRHVRGQRVDEVARTPSASSTHSPISHDVSPALAEAG